MTWDTQGKHIECCTKRHCLCIHHSFQRTLTSLSLKEFHFHLTVSSLLVFFLQVQLRFLGSSTSHQLMWHWQCQSSSSWLFLSSHGLLLLQNHVAHNYAKFTVNPFRLHADKLAHSEMVGTSVKRNERACCVTNVTWFESFVCSHSMSRAIFPKNEGVNSHVDDVEVFVQLNTRWTRTSLEAVTGLYQKAFSNPSFSGILALDFYIQRPTSLFFNPSSNALAMARLSFLFLLLSLHPSCGVAFSVESNRVFLSTPVSKWPKRVVGDW